MTYNVLTLLQLVLGEILLFNLSYLVSSYRLLFFSDPIRVFEEYFLFSFFLIFICFVLKINLVDDVINLMVDVLASDKYRLRRFCRLFNFVR